MKFNGLILTAYDYFATATAATANHTSSSSSSSSAALEVSK